MSWLHVKIPGDQFVKCSHQEPFARTTVACSKSLCSPCWCLKPVQPRQKQWPFTLYFTMFYVLRCNKPGTWFGNQYCISAAPALPLRCQRCWAGALLFDWLISLYVRLNNELDQTVDHLTADRNILPRLSFTGRSLKLLKHHANHQHGAKWWNSTRTVLFGNCLESLSTCSGLHKITIVWSFRFEVHVSAFKARERRCTSHSII